MEKLVLREIAEKVSADVFLAIAVATVDAVNCNLERKYHVTSVCPHCLKNEVIGTLRILDGSSEVPSFHAQDAVCYFTVESMRNVPHVLHAQYGQLWAIAFLRSDMQERDDVYKALDDLFAVNRYSVSTYVNSVLRMQTRYIAHLVQNVFRMHKQVDGYDAQQLHEWINAQREDYMQHEYQLQQAQWTY